MQQSYHILISWQHMLLAARSRAAQLQVLVPHESRLHDNVCSLLLTHGHELEDQPKAYLGCSASPVRGKATSLL